MSHTQPDIWRGWAQCCLNDGITIMPAWVKQAVHKNCKDPDIVWAELLDQLAKPLVNDQYVALRCMDLCWGTL